MTTPPPPRLIAFVGYRGSGKSTLAAALAQRLNLPFRDTDHEIERRTRRSIADIFRTDGEPAFRTLETAALRDLARAAPAILSLGGGAVLARENRALLRTHAYTIWLTASVPELARRLADAEHARPGARPPLRGTDAITEIETVLRDRLPAYQLAADHTLDTTARSRDDCLAELLTLPPIAALRHPGSTE